MQNCGRNMVIKSGRYGKFLACPGFPECKNTKPIIEEVDVSCPKCGGVVVCVDQNAAESFMVVINILNVISYHGIFP